MFDAAAKNELGQLRRPKRLLEDSHLVALRCAPLQAEPLLDRVRHANPV